MNWFSTFNFENDNMGKSIEFNITTENDLKDGKEYF